MSCHQIRLVMKLGRFTLVEVEGVKFAVTEDHLASSKMGLRRGCITIRLFFRMSLVNTTENTVSNVLVYCVQSVSVKVSSINCTPKRLDSFIFDAHVTLRRIKFLIIKPNRCTNISDLFLE